MLIKKIILLALTFSISTTTVSALPTVKDSVSGLSYSELAEEVLTKELTFLVERLVQIDNLTPPHETKELRKMIGRFKGLLDLFAYVYPIGKKTDYWNKLRRELDDGYAFYGKFKDLFDIQNTKPEFAVYDEKIVRPVRKRALKWTKNFLYGKKLKTYQKLIKNPSRVTSGINSRSI